jgi:nucleoid-associated protein YgaU
MSTPPPLPLGVEPNVPGTLPFSGADDPPTTTETPPARRVLPPPAPLEREPEVAPSEVPPKKGVRGTGALYVVKSGDTLSEIAESQLGSSRRWKEIVDLNPGLDPRRVRAGAKLRLPAAGAATTPAPAPTPTPSVAASGEYVVREGDSLWIIASRTLGNGARWAEIAKANPGLDADRLRVGQKLRLPTGAASPAQPAPDRVAQTTPERSRSRGVVR